MIYIAEMRNGYLLKIIHSPSWLNTNRVIDIATKKASKMNTTVARYHYVRQTDITGYFEETLALIQLRQSNKKIKNKELIALRNDEGGRIRIKWDKCFGTSFSKPSSDSTY
jgi:hypothetical protein